MYKQHYIGKGPEAKALLDIVRAKVSAFNNECDRLSKKFKAEGLSISGDKRTLDGLVFLHRLSNEELKERGLKLFHHGKSDGQEEFYYSPRLNTNAGKELAAALKPITVVDASAEIISALNIGKLVVAPTKHGGIFCTALHRSQAGYSGDTLVVVIPYGDDTEDEKGSVVIPGWLRPCKESEALAVFDK